MTIGYLIKYKRSKLSISQKELAEQLNISIQRLNNFETGIRVPPLSMLDNLAKILNFNVNNFKKKYDESLSFNLNIFKDKLANYRKDKNLTLNELSDIIKISRQTLSKYEKGESYPNIDDYYSICQTLNIAPSYFIYEEKDNYMNNKYSFLKYLIPSLLIIIISLFIVKYFIEDDNSNKDNINSNYHSLSSSTNSSSNEEINEIEINSFNVMNQSTIDLIKDSTNKYYDLYYNQNITRPYTIHINDDKINDINFYYNEWVFFPLYFDEEKFISHYVDENNNYFWGIYNLNYEKDIYLSPVYLTYEEYINNLDFYIKDNEIIIQNSSPSLLYIIPSEINGISDFKIEQFNSSNTIFIANEANIIFDGLKMDCIPSTYFINAKNIEFKNQDINHSNIKFVAINQNYNYEKTRFHIYRTSFISIFKR